MAGSALQCASHFSRQNWQPLWGRSGPGLAGIVATRTTLRCLLLGFGFTGLLIPVLYLYLHLAVPGPAAVVTAVFPVTGTLVAVALGSFLLGWVTIVALSFPYPSVPWARGQFARTQRLCETLTAKVMGKRVWALGSTRYV